MENIKLLSEAVGFIATLLMLYSFTKTDDKTLIIIHTMSNVFWGIHFLILGAFAGMLSILFSLTRTAFVFKWNSNVAKISFMVALSIYCGYEAYKADQLYNLLPIAATMIVSAGILFYEKSKLTFIFIVSNVLWIIYAIIVNSWSGTISYILMVIILIYRIFKIKTT